jgi:D-alanyl-D-alanine carboxypeptidase
LNPARLVVSYVLRRAILALLAIFFAVQAAPEAHAVSSRYSSIVIDYDTGAVLHAVNADKRSYPASVTKVMTLYLLFDALDSGKLSLNSMLPVSEHATDQSPSKLNLAEGDHISVEQVILALVTKSANDAAVVAAEAVGGTEENFAQMMTAKARSLGMKGTVYRNASGLPNPGQVSTVRDQATLARALIRNHGDYYRYFATRTFSFRGMTIPSHNRLMLRYQGADGIKTGYINASGFNLVSSAKRDGRRIIGVVFGGDTAAWRDKHMGVLLDKGFAKLNKGEQTQIAKVDDEQDLPNIDDLKLAAESAAPAKAAKVKQAKFQAPKKKQVAQVDDDDDEDEVDESAWGIQVGAFNDTKSAHKAATDAAKRLGGLVFKANVEVNKGKAGKHSVFRARLNGFTEEQARAACKRLSRAGKSCKVVQPS